MLREVERMSDEEIGDLVGLRGDAVDRLFGAAAEALARALGCSREVALEGYRRWPLAAAPWSASQALVWARYDGN